MATGGLACAVLMPPVSVLLYFWVCRIRFMASNERVLQKTMVSIDLIDSILSR